MINEPQTPHTSSYSGQPTLEQITFQAVRPTCTGHAASAYAKYGNLYSAGRDLALSSQFAPWRVRRPPSSLGAGGLDIGL